MSKILTRIQCGWEQLQYPWLEQGTSNCSRQQQKPEHRMVFLKLKGNY